MTKGLVSIVMPVKNANQYLEECIDSILKQSERNWELIAVNDHSTDDSFQMLKKYAEKDNRVRTLNSDGEGIIDALKTAYKASLGEFIHRMDADDIMPEIKLAELKKILIAAGAGHVATGKVKYIAKDGIGEGYLKYEQWLNHLCDEGNHWEKIYKECVIPSPCWLVHREDFDRCDGFNPDRYPEDYDLVFRFREQKLKVVSSGECLHIWRDYSQRTSRNHNHYKQNYFFELKLHYFLKLERDSKRPLVIWGAGQKGKIMAKILNEQEQDFTWVSNNPNKNGKEIYQQIMQSFEKILAINNPQVIVTVAQRNSKDEIVDFLEARKLKQYKDFWFFR